MSIIINRTIVSDHNNKHYNYTDGGQKFYKKFYKTHKIFATKNVRSLVVTTGLPLFCGHNRDPLTLIKTS